MHNELFYTNKKIDKFKIAVISDIHYYQEYKDKIFCRIIKQMKNNKPDYITVVGDILDSSNIKDIKRLIKFFKELADIAPTLFVKGNHDEKTGHMNNWYYQENQLLLKELDALDNVYFLDDNIYQDKNITFYGFNLSYNYYECEMEDYDCFCKEVSNLKCHIPDDTYNITLIHSPINIYKYIKENKNSNLAKSDLILSGHMHNGCLPFIISHPINKLFKSSRGLISPNRKLFPKYAQGRVYEETEGYVYEGISKLSNSTKLFHKLDGLFKKNVEFITIEKR